MDEEQVIVVYGAFSGSDDSYQHTLQLYCPSLGRTTHTLTLATPTHRPVCGLLLVNGDTLLAFAADYTAVCSIRDIREGRPDRCAYRSSYTLPNCRCAVALSPDRQYVVAVGGRTPGSATATPNYVYRGGGGGGGWGLAVGALAVASGLMLPVWL